MVLDYHLLDGQAVDVEQQSNGKQGQSPPIGQGIAHGLYLVSPILAHLVIECEQEPRLEYQTRLITNAVEEANIVVDHSPTSAA